MRSRIQTRLALAGLLSVCVLVDTTSAAESPDPLKWESNPGYRSAPLKVDPGSAPGFTSLGSSATGIVFTNALSDLEVAQNRLREVGSGVALGDVDGDGWTDLYLCRMAGPNALYRNRGNWTFEDITAASGVACPERFSTGSALVDLDGDGDLDLLVNRLGGGTRAFRNLGGGRFEEITKTILARQFGAVSMALADIEGDGDLDLYVTHYRTDTMHDHPPGLQVRQQASPDGRIVIEPRDRVVGLPTRAGGIEVLERGEPDILYLNRGGGDFTPSRWDSGVFLDEDGVALTGAWGEWGLAALFRDLDGDRHPDLYVCNDFIFWPDRLWRNDSGRRLRAAPRLALRHISLASMSVDVADINRDGQDDLFVADMLTPSRTPRAWRRPDLLRLVEGWPAPGEMTRLEIPHNTLQVSRGDGTYAEVAAFAGLAATDWTWGCAFLDVDLDGWEDLLLATGANHDVQDMDAMAVAGRGSGWRTVEDRRRSFGLLPRRATASMAFRNRHDLTFEDRSGAWGFDQQGVAQGMALGDLDNDGDLDVVINCMNGPVRLLRNECAASRIAVRLKGAGANTRGIGARILVRGGPVEQSQEMVAGGRYASSDDPIRTFAAGGSTNLTIEVRWRRGGRRVITGARPNHLYEVEETGSEPTPVVADSVAPWFEEVPTADDGDAVLESFDDFQRHPLLHRRLSTEGPGLAWFDGDAEGSGELRVGGRRGRGSRLWRGPPVPGSGVPTRRDAGRSNTFDALAVLGVVDRKGERRVWTGGTDWTAPSGDPLLRCETMQGVGVPLPRLDHEGHPVSVGALAAADVRGEGRLQVFVGGRLVAGRYPEAAPSFLLEETDAGIGVAHRFEAMGRVTGAVFTDWDADGDPDLAIAQEWGPPRLFRNESGRWTEWIPQVRSVRETRPLSAFSGWWNGVAAGDFDGDGRMDLVLSNWGRNWRPEPLAAQDIPVELHHGRWEGASGILMLVASWDPRVGASTPWRERDAVVPVLPSLPARIPDYHAYGRAPVTEVLGGASAATGVLKSGWFASVVLLNRGDEWELRELPAEAQWTPAFGISVLDVDGDGREDLFLAQNFFGVDPESTRQDAGTGLVLQGDGRGDFRALRPHEAGFSLAGECRGSVVADWDRDGRPDLVVAEPSGRLHWLRNRRAPPGVVVHLRGPTGNPEAVGARVRIRSGGAWGPVREIHAGSGHAAQDSARIPIATEGAPEALEVVWPGGRRREWPWSAGATRVETTAESFHSLP